MKNPQQDIFELVNRVDVLENKLAELEAERDPPECISILVTSGQYDKFLTAFIIATGAAALGIEVKMFFTFWGITALKQKIKYSDKTLNEKIMTAMMPSNPETSPLSSMNMFGAGRAFIKQVMKQNNVANLSELIQTAQSLGVRMSVCKMSLDMMGISEEELINDVKFCGIAQFVDESYKATTFVF